MFRKTSENPADIIPDLKIRDDLPGVGRIEAITADFSEQAALIVAFSNSLFHEAYHIDLCAYEEAIRTDPKAIKPDLAQYLKQFQESVLSEKR